MTAGLVTHGYIGGGGGADFSAHPTLYVLTSFASSFKEARTQLWRGEIKDWPDGAEMIIIVRYSERNETITARDAEGNWCWPFDVVEDNIVNVAVDPATVQLRPRGGWPPCDVEIQIAAADIASLGTAVAATATVNFTETEAWRGFRLTAKPAGDVGNSYTLQFVADGVGIGSLTDGPNAVYHYENNVTLASDVVTALAASSYMSATLDTDGTIKHARTVTFSGGIG